MDEYTDKKGGPPSWLAPVVVVLLIVALFAGSRKKDEVVENPLVELGVLTVAVFAFAAVFRFVAVKMGAPGLAAFFGSNYTRAEQPQTQEGIAYYGR